METQELGITAHGYLASPISDNIREMEDGTLVIESCPVARTGWMQYAIRDLPQEAARKLGVDVSNPSASIDLYRSPQDVFAPEFLASLNGRPICENHPPDFVTPETFSKYAQGHMQNVRKGDEPLENGEWPIVADLIISAEPLVSKVLNKELRELSLGYDYSIKRVGEQIRQVGMMGNHLAVVSSGRAGDEVRINDAAPANQASTRAAPSETEAIKPPGPGTRLVAQTVNASTTKKEKPKVKNNWKHIFGLGLRAKAADADTDPEELAELALDIGKRGMDAEEEEVEEPIKDRKAKDRKKAKDLEEDPIDEDREPAMDRRREAMHDALDKLMEGNESASDRKATDEDLNELGDMLKEFFGQESKEPEHKADDVVEEEEPEVVDADPAELEELLGAGEEPDAEDAVEADPGEVIEPSGEEALVEDDAEEAEMGECAHCGEATDAANCPKCGCKDRKAKDKAKAADAAAGVKSTLKYLRPFIARSNDAAAKAAWNNAMALTTRSSKATTSSYGAFANSARARDSKRTGSAPPAVRAEEANTKLQSVYDQLREKGGK